MNNKDILELCFGNLRRRKTRTILAIVGVVIGTCAIIVMLSIGFALTHNMKAMIESYGSLHTVDVYNWGGGMQSSGERAVLNDKAVSKMEALEGVSAATPVVEQYVAVGVGKKITHASLMGIRADVMETFGFNIQEGRSISASDKMGMVFGSEIPRMFFDPRRQQWADGSETINVVGEKVIVTADYNYGTKHEGEGDIRYEKYDGKAVGLLEEKHDQSSWSIIMNIDDVRKIQEDAARAEKRKPEAAGQAVYQRVMLYVDDINDVQGVCDIIRDEMGFTPSSLNDWLESTKDTTRMIQGILGGIGAVSLLVAALGIANTMIMSIYERTREIGVMKVIGAELSDIKKMFLLEAGMIGFFGGIMGIALSYILSFAMNTFLVGAMQGFLGTGNPGDKVSVIPVWVVGMALIFSSAIGLVSGYYPARRAMRLSALEGLKNE